MTDTPAQPDSVLDPEAWDHLARHRDRKQRCADALEVLHDACPQGPGHVKVAWADCKVCHRKMVDRVSHRYLDGPETEWYADRRPFLQHLAELFPAVKRGEVDASGIEDRVMDEKQKWYRENVRRVAVALGGFGMPERKEQLLKLMDDRKVKFPDFCARVTEVIARGMKPCPPGALERLISTRNDPKARVEAYKEIFFFPYGEQDGVGESTRKYLEMVEQGVSMSKVARMMVEERRQGLVDRAGLEKLQNRIEHLKKAKATWLAQRKRGQADEEEPKVPPPCSRCGLPQEVPDPPSCSLCQVAVAHGIIDEAVVYCGEECQRLAHGQHVAEAHKCAAGAHCITLYQPDEDEESRFPDPTNDKGDAYLCRECLEQRKTVAVFYTLACAEANFSHHSEDVHPRTSRSVGPPEAVRKHNSYEARTEAQTRPYLVTLEQALQDMKEKKVIDKFILVPKLRLAVEPLKTQPAENSDEHIDLMKGGDLPPKAEEHVAKRPPTDYMDIDGACEIEEAPASPARATSRQSDKVPGHDHMEGVETQPAPHPSDDRNADTEMMDAVDVADFAAKPEPAAAEPAPTAAELAAEEAQPGAAADPESKVPREAAPPTSESKPESKVESKPVSKPDSKPESGSDAKSTSQPYPFKNIPVDSHDPAEAITLASPKTAEEVNRPSKTVAAADKITSIEPMPSLGRSLEIEISPIQAGGGARSEEADEEEPPSESELAHIRNAAVEAMDKIADEKAQGIDYGAIGHGEVGDEAEWEEAEREERAKRGMSASGDAAAASAAAKMAVDKAVAAVEHGERAADALDEQGDKGGEGEAVEKETGGAKGSAVEEGDGSDKPNADRKAEDEQPVVSQQPKGDATTSDKPAESVEKEVAQAPDADVSHNPADSLEEGEISDDSSKKRKASVEPGEVEEDGREAKKARSVDPADGRERTSQD